MTTLYHKIASATDTSRGISDAMRESMAYFTKHANLKSIKKPLIETEARRTARLQATADLLANTLDYFLAAPSQTLSTIIQRSNDSTCVYSIVTLMVKNTFWIYGIFNPVLKEFPASEKLILSRLGDQKGLVSSITSLPTYRNLIALLDLAYAGQPVQGGTRPVDLPSISMKVASFIHSEVVSGMIHAIDPMIKVLSNLIAGEKFEITDEEEHTLVKHWIKNFRKGKSSYRKKLLAYKNVVADSMRTLLREANSAVTQRDREKYAARMTRLRQTLLLIEKSLQAIDSGNAEAMASSLMELDEHLNENHKHAEFSGVIRLRRSLTTKADKYPISNLGGQITKKDSTASKSKEGKGQDWKHPYKTKGQRVAYEILTAFGPAGLLAYTIGNNKAVRYLGRKSLSLAAGTAKLPFKALRGLLSWQLNSTNVYDRLKVADKLYKGGILAGKLVKWQQRTSNKLYDKIDLANRMYKGGQLASKAYKRGRRGFNNLRSLVSKEWNTLTGGRGPDTQRTEPIFDFPGSSITPLIPLSSPSNRASPASLVGSGRSTPLLGMNSGTRLLSGPSSPAPVPPGSNFRSSNTNYKDHDELFSIPRVDYNKTFDLLDRREQVLNKLVPAIPTGKSYNSLVTPSTTAGAYGRSEHSYGSISVGPALLGSPLNPNAQSPIFSRPSSEAQQVAQQDAATSEARDRKETLHVLYGILKQLKANAKATKLGNVQSMLAYLSGIPILKHLFSGLIRGRSLMASVTGLATNPAVRMAARSAFGLVRSGVGSVFRLGSSLAKSGFSAVRSLISSPGVMSAVGRVASAALPVAAVAGAGALGWEVGSWLYEKFYYQIQGAIDTVVGIYSKVSEYVSGKINDVYKWIVNTWEYLTGKGPGTLSYLIRGYIPSRMGGLSDAERAAGVPITALPALPSAGYSSRINTYPAPASNTTPLLDRLTNDITSPVSITPSVPSSSTSSSSHSINPTIPMISYADQGFFMLNAGVLA